MRLKLYENVVKTKTRKGSAGASSVTLGCGHGDPTESEHEVSSYAGDEPADEPPREIALEPSCAG